VILGEEEPVPKSDQRLKQVQTASWLQSTPVPDPHSNPTSALWLKKWLHM